MPIPEQLREWAVKAGLISLREARERLHVHHRRLLGLLDDAAIEPVRRAGYRYLTAADFARVEAALVHPERAAIDTIEGRIAAARRWKLRTGGDYLDDRALAAMLQELASPPWDLPCPAAG